MLRPVVLFGHSPAERARQTGSPERTLYRQVARFDDSIIEQLIRRHFDLRPGGIIEDLQLEQPIYRRTAVYGHFGRNDVPWERVDKVPALAADVGL